MKEKERLWVVIIVEREIEREIAVTLAHAEFKWYIKRARKYNQILTSFLSIFTALENKKTLFFAAYSFFFEKSKEFRSRVRFLTGEAEDSLGPSEDEESDEEKNDHYDNDDHDHGA